MTSLASHRKYKKYALVSGAVALTAAAVYAYRCDAFARSKRYFGRLRQALQRYTEAFAIGGDMCATFMRDLHDFMNSRDDEVPSTLRQLAKLIQSEEFGDSTRSVANALYRGLIRTQTSKSSIVHPNMSSEDAEEHVSDAVRSSPPSSSKGDALDRILDALLSDRGHSLVSVAVSMGAKNLMSAYVDATARQQRLDGVKSGSGGGTDATDKLLAFLTTPEGQQLAVVAVAALASNGMRVYMDKSLSVNLYDDLFSALAKPAHLNAVKQCVSIFARDVVATYMQGGISVTTSSKSSDGQHGATETERASDEAGETGRHVEVIERTVVDGTTAGVDGENSNDDRRLLETLVRCRIESEGIVRQNSESYDVSAVSIEGSPSSPESVHNAKVGHIVANSTYVDPDAFAKKSSKIVKEHLMLVHDDLDSDSLLFVGRQSGPDQKSRLGWVKAVGKEYLTVSCDPNGRKAMAAMAGSVTQGAVTGMACAVASHRFTALMVTSFVLAALFAVLWQQFFVSSR